MYVEWPNYGAGIAAAARAAEARRLARRERPVVRSPYVAEIRASDVPDPRDVEAWTAAFRRARTAGTIGRREGR